MPESTEASIRKSEPSEEQGVLGREDRITLFNAINDHVCADQGAWGAVSRATRERLETAGWCKKDIDAICKEANMRQLIEFRRFKEGPNGPSYRTVVKNGFKKTLEELFPKGLVQGTKDKQATTIH